MKSPEEKAKAVFGARASFYTITHPRRLPTQRAKNPWNSCSTHSRTARVFQFDERDGERTASQSLVRDDCR